MAELSVRDSDIRFGALAMTCAVHGGHIKEAMPFCTIARRGWLVREGGGGGREGREGRAG
jgi:hypothetical protein